MPPEHQRFVLGSVEIDIGRRTITRDGEAVLLTPTEWRLLARLAEDPGRLVLNVELLTSVWGPSYATNVPYLRVWVSRLRRKLEPVRGETALIKTMQAIGYMLDVRPVE